MEQHLEIEQQLWEYIDGICDGADTQRISLLITTNALWKEKYQYLIALHESIAGIEGDQPSLRFTKNVMDAVSTAHIVRATKQYFNMGVIRGIAALFILALVAVLVYAIALAKPHAGNAAVFPKLNLTRLFSSGFLDLIVCINIVLGLAFADLLLRKKRLHPSS